MLIFISPLAPLFISSASPCLFITKDNQCFCLSKDSKNLWSKNLWSSYWTEGISSSLCVLGRALADKQASLHTNGTPLPARPWVAPTPHPRPSGKEQQCSGWPKTTRSETKAVCGVAMLCTKHVISSKYPGVCFTEPWSSLSLHVVWTLLCMTNILSEELNWLKVTYPNYI